MSSSPPGEFPTLGSFSPALRDLTRDLEAELSTQTLPLTSTSKAARKSLIEGLEEAADEAEAEDTINLEPTMTLSNQDELAKIIAALRTDDGEALLASVGLTPTIADDLDQALTTWRHCTP